MARKKKHAKKKKTRRKIKGRGYFSKNQYNTYNYSRKRKQRGGFLNRYDFAYAGRDTVKQASKKLEKIGLTISRGTLSNTIQIARNSREKEIRCN